MQDFDSAPQSENTPQTGHLPATGGAQTPQKTHETIPLSSQTATAAWCVILHEETDDSGSDDPLARLGRVLDARRVDSRIVRNPYFAMVELVRRERSRRADASPTTPAPTILVIAAGEKSRPTERQQALERAARRVISNFACWWYDPSRSSALLDIAQVIDEPEVVVRPAAVRAFHRHTTTTLRLSGDGPDGEAVPTREGAPNGAQPAGAAELSEESILTEEELRLLLSEDDDTQTTRRGRS